MGVDRERMRLALEKAGVTGAKLADHLGLSRGMISHWLQGHRDCPPKYAPRIADFLHVDLGWLSEGPMTSPARESHAPLLEGPDSIASAAWNFRPAPNDGGRDYGSANIWTVPADLATFAREVGQNSLDNSLDPGTTVQLRFQLIELTWGHELQRNLMEALNFGTLKAHVLEASLTKSRLATRLRSGLKRLEDGERLVLLRIDDYGTTGLYGKEVTADQRDQNPFAALVRNNLDSSKQVATAGGSFGLGKAVLWRCSDISTILFASHIAPEKRGDATGYRFMGKSELTWHELEGQPYAGPGWLGKNGSDRPDSLWLPREELVRLLMDRDDLPAGVDAGRAWGTSILIVGFRDPISEEVQDTGRIIQELAKAVALNFWPSIIRGHLRVNLQRIVDGEQKEEIREVDPTDYVPELCEALLKYDDGEVTEHLEENGDVLRSTVNHPIPKTQDGVTDLIPFPDELDAQAQLVVRLAGEDVKDAKNINSIALVRGREMVVRYWKRDNLVVGALPFHAVLLAGTAAGSDHPHLAAEQFLRLAEPPAHDRWVFNDEIREKYAWGAGRRLNALEEVVTEALRKAIKPYSAKTEEGPAQLKRLLQLGVPRPPEPKPAVLRHIKPHLTDGKWHVEADIYINERDCDWFFSPRLIVDAESGTKPRLPWKKLELLDDAGGKAVVQDSKIRVASQTRRIRFRAISDRVAKGVVVAAKCRARLDIRAEKATKPRGGDNG